MIATTAADFRRHCRRRPRSDPYRRQSPLRALRAKSRIPTVFNSGRKPVLRPHPVVHGDDASSKLAKVSPTTSWVNRLPMTCPPPWKNSRAGFAGTGAPPAGRCGSGYPLPVRDHPVFHLGDHRRRSLALTNRPLHLLARGDRIEVPDGFGVEGRYFRNILGELGGQTGCGVSDMEAPDAKRGIGCQMQARPDPVGNYPVPVWVIADGQRANVPGTGLATQDGFSASSGRK